MSQEDKLLLFKSTKNDYYSRDGKPALTLVVDISKDCDIKNVIDFITSQFRPYGIYFKEEAIYCKEDSRFVEIYRRKGKSGSKVTTLSLDIYKWIYCEDNGDFYEYTYSEIANQKLWMKNVQKFKYKPNK